MIWRYFKQLRSDFKLIGQTEVSRVSTTQAEQESLQDCEARSIGLDQRMQHLWIPGRRWWLIRQSYDVGYVARQRDAAALAERNFRRAIDLMEDKCPRRSKSSLATFAIVAACHNHLGLLYLDERRMDDAIVAFDAAIACSPKIARTKFILVGPCAIGVTRARTSTQNRQPRFTTKV
jgi:hypothetical protein